MKNTILLCAVCLLAAGSCSKSKGGGVKLRTDVDSVAYIIGMNVGENLLKMDSTININAVCEGIRDVARGSGKLSQEQARAYFLRYMNHTLPEKSRAYEEQFLEEIVKTNRSYARTESGVTYTVEAVGDQEQIPSSDRDSVAVRYVIRTAGGQQLYSSYERRDTTRMALGDLRPGMQQSVKLIGKGGKILAWLPAATAYGVEGDKTLGVAPNATLYYEIELVGVDKANTRARRAGTRREF